MLRPEKCSWFAYGSALRSSHAFKTNRDTIGLQRGESHGAIPGVLVQLLAPDLALFFQRFEMRMNGLKKLHDD